MIDAIVEVDKLYDYEENHKESERFSKQIQEEYDMFLAEIETHLCGLAKRLESIDIEKLLKKEVKKALKCWTEPTWVFVDDSTPVKKINPPAKAKKTPAKRKKAK